MVAMLAMEVPALRTMQAPGKMAAVLAAVARRLPRSPGRLFPRLATSAGAKPVHHYGAWEAATAACCPPCALVPRWQPRWQEEATLGAIAGDTCHPRRSVHVPQEVLLHCGGVGAEIHLAFVPVVVLVPALLLALSGAVRLESAPLAQLLPIVPSERVLSAEVANRAMHCHPR